MTHTLAADSTPDGRRWLIGAVIVSIAVAALNVLVVSRPTPDFVFLWGGAQAALAGEDPYDAANLKIRLDQHLRSRGSSAKLPEGGFFYPPATLLLLAPLGSLPYSAAYYAWVTLLELAVIACAALAWCMRDRPFIRPFCAAAAVVLVLSLNPQTQGALGTGQTTLLICGAIALGQMLYERGGRWYWPSILVSSIAATKPNLALPLFCACLLAGGGWKRAIHLGIVIAACNVLGSLMLPDKLHGLVRYPSAVAAAHHAVDFNRTRHFSMVSWPRALYALSGQRIEINPGLGGMLAGMAVWAAAGWARLRLAGQRWTPAFLLAFATAGSLLFAQAHLYDTVILILLAPWVIVLWQRRQWRDVALLVAIWLIATAPWQIAQTAAAKLHFRRVGPAETLLVSFRAIMLVVLGIYLLVRAQKPLEQPLPRTD